MHSANKSNKLEACNKWCNINNIRSDRGSNNIFRLFPLIDQVIKTLLNLNVELASRGPSHTNPYSSKIKLLHRS